MDLAEIPARWLSTGPVDAAFSPRDEYGHRRGADQRPCSRVSGFVSLFAAAKPATRTRADRDAPVS